MLSLALVGGDEPLIIDQSEDDLDNRYIYSDVVRQLSEVGSVRQVIVGHSQRQHPRVGRCRADRRVRGFVRPSQCFGVRRPR